MLCHYLLTYEAPRSLQGRNLIYHEIGQCPSTDSVNLDLKAGNTLKLLQRGDSSGARISAGLRRSAAGVTLLWKYRYQRWYLDRRTWIWTSYDLASGLSDVDYQTNLSYPLAHVYCPSQLTLMMDNGPSLKWTRRRANVQH